MTDIPRVDWFGCYDDSWQQAPLLAEAYSHPAKVPFGLADRIYRHMLAKGMIKPGQRVVDCFGGVGGLSFHAALYGLHWTGCELEARFVELGDMEYDCPGFSQDFWRRYHKRPAYIAKLRAEYKLCPSCETALAPKTVLQKRTKHDSRPRFVLQRAVPERPPHVYRGNIPLWRERYAPVIAGYGSARLLPGDSRWLRRVIAEADACVSSPPYIETEVAQRTHQGDMEGHVETRNEHGRRYSVDTPGQLGTMPAGIAPATYIGVPADSIVSSPPYAETEITQRRNFLGPHSPDAQLANISTTDRQNGYGDSPGNLGALPAGSHDAVVSSPPYAQARIDGHGDEGASGMRAEDGSYLRGADGWQQRKAMGGRYGDSDGNLANLPAGELADSVVSSPPYAESAIAKNSAGVDLRKQYDTYRSQGGGASFEAFEATQRKHSGDYGASPGQLGSMPAGDYDASLASPPYAQAVSGMGGPFDFSKTARDGDVSHQRHGMADHGFDYGSTPGQLADLKAGDWDASVASPPYADGAQHTGGETRMTSGQGGPIAFVDYGDSPGQLAGLPADNSAGETFWSAARAIMEETYAILKPGGYAVWITGDFVRDKKRVLFGEQWLALCESVGFEPVLWAVAWKAETHGAQLDMFGEPVELKTSKVSFFRRLANRNNPDAAIENEDVIFVRKPLEDPR